MKLKTLDSIHIHKFKRTPGNDWLLESETWYCSCEEFKVRPWNVSNSPQLTVIHNTK